MGDYDLVSFEALGTDRHAQWNRLQEAWKTPRHLVILLPGPREQYPELFVKRVWYWLQATDMDQRQIPQHWGEEHPVGKSGWELCLRHAFGDPKLRTPTILRDALSRRPLFLPFAPPALGPGVLADDARDGLLAFLREGLPAVLPVPPGVDGGEERVSWWRRWFRRRTEPRPSCAHPLRILVTVRLEWADLFWEALEKRDHPELLDTCLLPSVSFPPWCDIEDQLKNR